MPNKESSSLNLAGVLVNENDEARCRDAFEDLKRWLEAEGCYVVIHGPDYYGANGAFTPPVAPRIPPRIEVFRSAGQNHPQPAHEELATLAHEAGHWRSWQRGERPDQTTYAAAVDQAPSEWPNLPEVDKRMIRDEEVRAWTHGLALLLELFADLPASFMEYYETRRIGGLAVYDEMLGV